MKLNSKQIREAICEKAKSDKDECYVLDVLFGSDEDELVKRKELENPHLWKCNKKSTLLDWIKNGYSENFFNEVLDKENSYISSTSYFEEVLETSQMWIVRHFYHKTIEIDCYVVTNIKDDKLLFIIWQVD